LIILTKTTNLIEAQAVHFCLTTYSSRSACAVPYVSRAWWGSSGCRRHRMAYRITNDSWASFFV